MNKYAILGIIIVLLIGGGFVFRLSGKGGISVESTGVVREIEIRVNEDTWAWKPDNIEAEAGDRLVLNVINEDDYDHGFAIDAFGISQRLPAEGSIIVDFVVTKAGEFPYYCSVSCGSGVVEGVERGHFDQIGVLKVKDLISTQ